MSDKYILDDHGEPKGCVNLKEWEEWFERSGNKRLVASAKNAGVYVSTVFLGLNHNFGDGEPVLFETMVFGGVHDEFCTRATTRSIAIEQHINACKMVWGIK